MFDAVLRTHEPQRGYLPAAGLSLAVYVLLLGASVYLAPSSRAPKAPLRNVSVTLFTALPLPPPPPPPPGAAAELPKVARKARPQLRPVEKELVQPKPTPEPVEVETVEPSPPEDAAPAESSGAEGGVVGGVPGGVAGGVPGGIVGGVLGGTSTQVLPFGEGMTRPVKVSGEEPRYTALATAARVEGKVLVRCVISIDGSVENCKVIKALPLLTEVVLGALAESRFTPVHYLGRPQAIQYLFTYSFKLP